LLKLLLLLAIVVIIFGAGKLPKIGAALGKSIRSLKESMRESREIDVTPKKEEDESKPT
jgi:sec-independent protein translocase protein TatA